MKNKADQGENNKNSQKIKLTLPQSWILEQPCQYKRIFYFSRLLKCFLIVYVQSAIDNMTLHLSGRLKPSSFY